MDQIRYCRFGALELIYLHNRPLNYKKHNHVSTYTVGLVLDGEVTLHCENQVRRVAAGGFFVIYPYQVHALSLPANYTLVSLCIQKKHLKQVTRRQLVEMLYKTLLQVSVKVRVALLADAVQALYSPNQPHTENMYLNKNVNALWQTPEENTNLQKMANEVYLSKFYYIKCFKQAVGLTPHQFQLQNKVRKAQRMIENGSTLSQTAVQLGFCDQSHFIKCFKAVVGLTPAQYRQAIQR
ncbi:MAG: hypothetical protein PWQ08_261 [Clostridiales bacterium]|nr:hypothetical protein [Clostridiales bacterium]